MKFDIRFKGIKHSDSLCEHTEERFQKLHKYEMKPVKANVTFSSQRHIKCAEAFIQGINKSFRAKAQGENYYDCLDELVRKISSQMSKEKAKIQHHKHAERSQLARIEREIEIQQSYLYDSNKKAA